MRNTKQKGDKEMRWQTVPFRHPRFPHVTEIAVPTRCPMCRQDAASVGRSQGLFSDMWGPYGEPSEVLLFDKGFPCEWLLMIGWTCDRRHPTKAGRQQAFFGTVIQHGPDADNAVHLQSHEHVYVEPFDDYHFTSIRE